MKFLLDFSPLVAFLVALMLTDIYGATIALMISLPLVFLIYLVWERRVHKVHLVGSIVALVLGGLTLYFHSSSFIKLKPTLLFGVIALALLASQFRGKKVLVQRLGESTVTLPDPVWRKVNLAWVVFYLVLAVLNIAVAHSFSDRIWGYYKVASGILFPIIFMLGHVPFLSKYMQDEGTAPKQGQG